MPSSGSGKLTPVGPGVPPSTIPAALPASCISLARYAEIIGADECAFWGVLRAGFQARECNDFWTERERWQIARYLSEAQAEIEQEIGYALCRRWFTDELHGCTAPIIAESGYVVAGGVRGEEAVALAAPVSYATEPATVGPIATTLTDETEIHAFYPSSDREITYSAIEIGGGLLTLWIPRCRLVAPQHFNETKRDPVDYTDVAKFTATVDVKRVYNDPSTQAKIVKAGCSCETTESDACIVVQNSRLGIVQVRQETYSGGSWHVSGSACGCCSAVKLNYYAGLYPISAQAEDAIIRLAHSKMPVEPCGCDAARLLWKRDRNVPETLSYEREHCPFGMSDGALVAWRFAQSMKLHRLGTSL